MKKNNFNDLEALKMAINIEKKGQRFYKSAAQKFSEYSDIANVLLDLARQEEEHAETFQQIYDDCVEEKQDFDDSYLFEPEVEAYLRALVETSVFPDYEEQDSILENIKKIDDVIRLGIRIEKESLLFYTEMIIQSKLPEAKAAFRKLLQEEKKHLIDFMNRIKK